MLQYFARASTLVFAGTLVFFVAASTLPARAGTAMSWWQFITRADQRITFSVCNERAQRALTATGLSAERHAGSDGSPSHTEWFGSSDGPSSAWVSCYDMGGGKTMVVFLVASSTGNGSGEAYQVRKRLQDSFLGVAAAAGSTTINMQGAGGWSSTWIRRATGNVWDAVWRNGGDIRPTIMQGGFNGTAGYFKRTYSSDGFLCEYRLTIGPDGRSISGTQSCPGQPGFNVSGTIVRN